MVGLLDWSFRIATAEKAAVPLTTNQKKVRKTGKKEGLTPRKIRARAGPAAYPTIHISTARKFFNGFFQYNGQRGIPHSYYRFDSHYRVIFENQATVPDGGTYTEECSHRIRAPAINLEDRESIRLFNDAWPWVFPTVTCGQRSGVPLRPSPWPASSPTSPAS